MTSAPRNQTRALALVVVFALAVAAVIASYATRFGWAYVLGMHAYDAHRYEAARRWLDLAGNRGHPAAMAMIGTMYLRGQGGAQNNRQAEYWLEKAADEGSVSAQALLGTMYATGVAVSPNQAKAIKWLSGAAENGDARSKELLRSFSSASKE